MPGDDREARVRSGSSRPAAPSMPSAPACASISEIADRRPGRDAELGGRTRESPHRRARPARAPCVPMRANPSAARSPRPIASKYDGSQRRSWPRYVHLHTVVHSERSSHPVARHVRKSARSNQCAVRRHVSGRLRLQPAQLRRLHLRRDRPADELAARDGAVASIAARVVDRAVIHPHDDVPAIVAVDAHRHRSTVCVDRDQRARRVEADADDRIRRDGRGSRCAARVA